MLKLIKCHNAGYKVERPGQKSRHFGVRVGSQSRTKKNQNNKNHPQKSWVKTDILVKKYKFQLLI